MFPAQNIAQIQKLQQTDKYMIYRDTTKNAKYKNLSLRQRKIPLYVLYVV